MFYELPKEIQDIIFYLDPTKKELFDKVVHQINFIPVLEHLIGTYEFFTHFKCTKKIQKERIQKIKLDAWRRYRQKTLKIGRSWSI